MSDRSFDKARHTARSVKRSLGFLLTCQRNGDRPNQSCDPFQHLRSPLLQAIIIVRAFNTTYTFKKLQTETNPLLSDINSQAI
jgi:hypothetical protein